VKKTTYLLSGERVDSRLMETSLKTGGEKGIVSKKSRGTDL